MSNKGSAFVVSGPAGVGKTSLVARLVAEEPKVVESVSWTTRAPRPNEHDGEHYHFVSQEQFDRKVEEGGFLEHVQLFDCAYGTCRSHVEELLESGLHVIMVIDVQGAMLVKERFPARSIFVLPPSLESLAERLRNRKTETDASVERRLLRAKEEMKVAEKYDHQLVNDDFEEGYRALREIVIGKVN